MSQVSAAICLHVVVGFPFHKQELCIYKLQDTRAGGLFLKYGSSFYLGKNHSRMARQWLFETAKKKIANLSLLLTAGTLMQYHSS